jgi:hypothetical protein
MDALIFNIVAIACLVAKLNDRKIISPEHLVAVESYVQTRCTSLKKQKGGNPMPSDLYGYPHPNYSPANENTNNTHMEQLNFQDNIARPSLGPPLETEYQGGAGNSANTQDSKILDNHVRIILRHHQMKISEEAKDSLHRLLRKHMRCLAKRLSSGRVTEAKLGQVLKQKQFSIFM